MHFIDTNILIYAFGDDDDTGRPQIARGLLEKADLAFSIQVFQEFYVQATHKRRKDPLTQADAIEFINSLTHYPVQNNNLSLLRQAFQIQSRYQTSFWDANIIAAASALNCSTLYSEDLNHGQSYGGVTAINPFC